MNVQWNKSPMREKRRTARPEILIQHSEQSLELVRASNKQAETLYVFPFLARQPKNFKTICAGTESNDFILKAL
jgi:hypothetical protein